MAKISIQFDTISKELDVTLDGENVENVSSIEIYAYEEGDINKGYIELRTVEVLEKDKIIKVIRLSADEKTVTSESVGQKQLHKDIYDAMMRKFKK